MSRFTSVTRICPLLVLLPILTVSAQVPDSISFQGYLTDPGGAVIDTTVPMTFKLYRDAVEVWTTNNPAVVVDSGAFNVVLGGNRLDTVAFNGPMKLGIAVGGDAEISHRTPLMASAFALGMRGMYAVRVTDGSTDAMNVVGGAPDNIVGPSVVGATIGGGGGWTGTIDLRNSVLANWGTVNGGQLNTAAGVSSTVGGGNQNSTEAAHSAIGGGHNNEATGLSSMIGGGAGNTAGGSASVVGGGDSNTSAGDFSTVGGGAVNEASGDFASIPGGLLNAAHGAYSLAAGYRSSANHDGTFVWNDRSDTTGIESFVSTGDNQFLVRAEGGVGIGTAAPTSQLTVHGSVELDSMGAALIFPDGSFQTTAAGSSTNWSLTGNSGTTPGTHFIGTTDSTSFEIKVKNSRVVRIEPADNGGNNAPNLIAGGSNNHVGPGAVGATIGGGGGWTSSLSRADSVLANWGTVSGGAQNLAAGSYSTVGGGHKNRAAGSQSTVGGGRSNSASDDYATVSGGHNNVAYSSGSFVGGGSTNSATGIASFVGGGSTNSAMGDISFIGGGDTNSATGTASFLGGGTSNSAAGYIATVSGGQFNMAADDFTSVGGGEHNSATGYLSAICGGGYNVASGNRSTVAGGISNEASGDSSAVCGGADNTTNASNAFVGGGYSNLASGTFSVVPGGWDNTASGNFSLAAGRRARALNHGSFAWADNSVDANLQTTADYQFLIRAAGGVGIGTASPGINSGDLLPAGAMLDVRQTSGRAAHFSNDDGGGLAGATLRVHNENAGSGIGGWILSEGTDATLIVQNLGTGDILTAWAGGNRRLRVTTHGEVIADSTFKPTGADVAESMDVHGSTSSYQPGDVLVISDRADRQAEMSASPYSTRVMGVYATSPGVVLSDQKMDDRSPDRIPVGVVGIVPTKVTSENGAIRRGDLLVTSTTSGHAMRADPDQLGFGMVLGKSLESFDGAGTGLIDVLLTIR